MKSPEQIFNEKKIMIDDLLKGNGKQIIVDAIRAGMEEGIKASADVVHGFYDTSDIYESVLELIPKMK